MTLGEKIQQLRKKQGWTQEELAERITVSRQALSKWEMGASIPDTENVLQISRLFEVSTDYLLKDDYIGDDDLSARQSNKGVREMSRNKSIIRIIIGACVSGASLIAMLIIGILSSVNPCTYIVTKSGEDGWVRAYTGLLGYLKMNNLEWLFILCILALIAGAITIFYPKLVGLFYKKHKSKA